MNILFVLYGGTDTNSFICLSRFAKELHRRGYQCAAVLHGTIELSTEAYLRLCTAEEVLKKPQVCFENQKRADILHAWTPRQNVVAFIRSYEALHSTPLFIYNEDDEKWIAEQFLYSTSTSWFRKKFSIFKRKKLPFTLSDPSELRRFFVSADMAGIITPKLQKDLPYTLPSEILFPGVDLTEFFPRPAPEVLRKRYDLDRTEKLIVYCGGINQFISSNIRDLCCMVTLLNQRGYRCRLVRSGVERLSNIAGIKEEELKYVLDLGLVPRAHIPDLMSLADVFVQPGRPSPFEEGRLPCKILEFMAMGIPTVLPNCNIALLLAQEEEALFHSTGLPEEMADICEKIFQDPLLERRLQSGARRFAETYFDIEKKVDQLERLYERTKTHYMIKQMKCHSFWSIFDLFRKKLFNYSVFKPQ